DIDLIDDHENITPIGVSTGANVGDAFGGIYDGGFHSVSNWGLVAATDTTYAGLFANMGGSLKHMRLDG
ncbi:unnamed protein product, partial [Ectocarpus sp. 12 AP-2014]